MYSTYNEGKSVVAERFIRTLKNKIYKHMTAISKNVYFDILSDIVDGYNNTYHRTIKMNPIDVKDDSFAEYNLVSNPRVPGFKINDDVRILKHKNFFAKGYFREEIVGRFYDKKNCRKLIKKNLELKK